MRILHISSESSWRGGEQQIAYLINELRDKGVENHVVSRSRSPFSDWCKKESIPFVEASFKSSISLSTAKTIKNYEQSIRADLIHIHSGKGHGAYAVSTLVGNSIPAVLSRRVDFPVKNNAWAQWKYNLKGIRKIICVSDAIKAMVQETVSRPENCVTVHSGIDLSRFQGSEKADLYSEFDIDRQKLLVGNVAALAPHKDYGTFIGAAKKAIEQGLNAHFLIIGEGPERQHIESLLSSQGMNDHITMTGFREDIPDVLRALDIFMITSETEGLGTSILDAFACSLPVLATAAGRIPELIIHERTGLLAPVKDVNTLSSELIRLNADKSLRQQLIQGASAHLQNFSTKAVAEKTLRIYESVL